MLLCRNKLFTLITCSICYFIFVYLRLSSTIVPKSDKFIVRRQVLLCIRSRGDRLDGTSRKWVRTLTVGVLVVLSHCCSHCFVANCYSYRNHRLGQVGREQQRRRSSDALRHSASLERRRRWCLLVNDLSTFLVSFHSTFRIDGSHRFSFASIQVV